MMMALASMRELPAVLVPGGVTLPPTTGEDAGENPRRSGPRFAHGEISLQDAADMGCRACATPGGGCQFLGTAATSQVVGEALGMSLTHTALAPSGQNIWSDMGLRSARAVVNLAAKGLTMNDIVTPEAIRKRHGRARRVWRFDKSPVAYSLRLRTPQDFNVQRWTIGPKSIREFPVSSMSYRTDLLDIRQ